MTTHLVIGAGEVGQALASVLDADLRDLEPGDTLRRQYPTVHICFPWSGRFTSAVDDYITAHDPDLVVVHSTVPPGICDTYGWVHSPIRGRHPHLVESIQVFTKHFGGARAADAAKPFADRGIDTMVHQLAATTEAAKLFELARLGIEVRIEKEIHAYCTRHQLPFDEVYDHFTRTYNSGYADLGDDQFLKPRLSHMPGPLGGHCVAQNTPLLDHQFFTDLLNPVTVEGWTGDLD